MLAVAPETPAAKAGFRKFDLIAELGEITVHRAEITVHCPHAVHLIAELGDLFIAHTQCTAHTPCTSPRCTADLGHRVWHRRQAGQVCGRRAGHRRRRQGGAELECQDHPAAEDGQPHRHHRRPQRPAGPETGGARVSAVRLRAPSSATAVSARARTSHASRSLVQTTAAACAVSCMECALHGFSSRWINGVAARFAWGRC